MQSPTSAELQQLCSLTCEPCKKGSTTINDQLKETYLAALATWEIKTRDGVDCLNRVYEFKNFAQALEFTQKIGELAEINGHHPCLMTEWGQVTVSWWTHKIKGLHEADFILAGRTEDIFNKRFEEALANI
ncbi:4a-hydroxytetrahydrobiopterin dehydratase [Algibacillus agarilyticus]|uniref:4a-hydroxytetrahydrobiopterin dehydratase n=1 Tax=Algibacillus agarilyticus TaxID=2234133 RepID=UPI000DD00106|nr:4a-hydroxytetrahydrobiopterin dehydratase [Algibacillus agarilyticus]